MAMTPVYDVQSVSVRRSSRAVLDAVSLQVEGGELLAIVGPNGAGKSTLLGVLAGDVTADEGRVLLDDAPLSDVGTAELARRRAMLLQHQQVSFGFRVEEVIAMGRSPWPVDPARDAEAIEAGVTRADVEHLLMRRFHELSGGEQARVGLARVLAQDTDILLLDEPTAALDLRHQEEVLRCVRDDTAAGRTVIIVLHDLSLALAYADRIALLDEGRLIAIGPGSQVLTPERVHDVYGVEVLILPTPDGPPVLAPRRVLCERTRQ